LAVSQRETPLNEQDIITQNPTAQGNSEHVVHMVCASSAGSLPTVSEYQPWRQGQIHTERDRVWQTDMDDCCAEMQIVNLRLPDSTIGLVPGTGVSLSIRNAFISLRGNWDVTYLGLITDSGSFDLTVSGLTITTHIALKSDEMGRPTVSSTNCVANVDRATVKFHGGASWLYNLFRSFVDKALRKALEKQLCPLVTDALSDMNPQLRTLNVLAQVDKVAEIEYSMVTSPTISQAFIDLDLKGEFYNVGKHQEPPFVATPFSLPAQTTSMLYIAVSTFTVNSAGFVYNNAGALNLDITDDMIPSISPLRLNTRTFGTFIPQVNRSQPRSLLYSI
ncbi:hypothetical protein AAFF_G00118830, partial [Aldrovandia affinis]